MSGRSAEADADAPVGAREAGAEGPGSPGRLERRPVHEGRIVRLSVDRVRFPDGSTGELEMIRHRGASAVLPFLDPPGEPDPRIVLVRQYRYAAGGHLYEVPAGMPREEGEPWEAVARRELREEAGYDAGTLVYLTRLHTTPGFTDEVIRLYAAHDLREAERELDEDEFMEVEAFPFSRVLEMVREGRITDGKSLVSILWGATFLRGGGAPD